MRAHLSLASKSREQALNLSRTLLSVPFAKLHACGNDFLVVEEQFGAPRLQAEMARRLCERHTGVGADGVEYFSWTGASSGTIHLCNADGSVAEISGNGTRCVAAWMAKQREAAAGAVMHIETDAGTRECRVVGIDDTQYEIVSGMGVPIFEQASVLLRDGSIVRGTKVNTGNPHFVVFVDDFHAGAGPLWQRTGEEICHHADFPDQTNVEFVHVINPEKIEIRIFERGVGPTRSSGTGTCASAIAAIAYRACSSTLSVEAPGGTQQVEWLGNGAEMFLTGSAVLVSEGSAWMTSGELEA